MKTGQIYAIAFGDGYVRTQYILEHSDPPRFGTLIRVFPGFHELAEIDFNPAEDSELFISFFPLRRAVRDKLAVLIGSASIPGRLTNFPTFREDVQGCKKLPELLWLWDGKREWRESIVDNPDTKKYPVREIVNAPIIADRVARGWKPEMDFYDLS